MRLQRSMSVTVALAAGGLLVGGVVAGPAAAHTHPTPVELDSPAAVQIRTYGEVKISLIEHNKVGAHIGLRQRTYTPLLSSGSGFAVDPSGAVVTSPKVIAADLRRAEIYAVNKIFNEVYGRRAPLPADPFTRHSVRDVDPVAQVAGRLQRCYSPNRTDSTGGCVVFSRRVVRVLPFVSSQQRYGNLAAEVISGPSSQVAVLKVGASSMPTVNLATSTEGVAAFAALGFSTTPSDAKSLRKADGHFTTKGGPTFKNDADHTKLIAAIREGLRGGPVVGEGGQVIGFLHEDPSRKAFPGVALVGPEKVRAALTAAGIEPHRGPTDAVYENALHNYNNKLYAASIPSLTQVVKLYPGHTMAAAALADANRKKGTAEDLTGQVEPDTAAAPGSIAGRSWVLPVAVGAAAILLLAAVLLLLRRRSRRPATPPAPQPGGTYGDGSPPMAPQPAYVPPGYARPGQTSGSFAAVPVPPPAAMPPAAMPPASMPRSSMPPAAMPPREHLPRHADSSPGVGSGSGVNRRSDNDGRSEAPGRPEPQYTVIRPRSTADSPLPGAVSPPSGRPASGTSAPQAGSPYGGSSDRSEASLRCRSCGERVPEFQQYCGHCGQRAR